MPVARRQQAPTAIGLLHSRFSFVHHNNAEEGKGTTTTSSTTNGGKVLNGTPLSPRNNVYSSSIKRVQQEGKEPTTPPHVWVCLFLCCLFTFLSRPTGGTTAGKHTEPTLRHVFFYGWLTALSTGLGALPFLCLPTVDAYWVGISNAIAAGMMIAASASLCLEGCYHEDEFDTSTLPPTLRCSIGALFGLAFLMATKSFLDRYEDLKLAGLQGTNARKALLIFFVMTLHSFSEGVGVGVSFGDGRDLGVFISASLAVHNVPEGLAMAVVLIPRGCSIATATLWAICTSLPQPIMAVPSYLFVHSFLPVLPVGLGFAGGAMAWVACAELLIEAVQDAGGRVTCCCTLLSLACMFFLQAVIAQETSSTATQ